MNSKLQVEENYLGSARASRAANDASSLTMNVRRETRRTTAEAAVLPGFNLRRGFTLIEVMVVVVLLSFIVLALMAVFDSTQKAFRASVTQTDVLEGGRATMDMMTEDLRAMAPSHGLTYGYYTNKCGNTNFIVTDGAVNFHWEIFGIAPYTPLVQPLVASVASGLSRTNVLENFFILKRENQTWTGVGYAVRVSPTNLYSLYRFSASTNVGAANPLALYNLFTNTIYFSAWTNMSYLMDGVLNLTVQAFNAIGSTINQVTNNIVTNPLSFPCAQENILSCTFYNGALPASVEIEMGVLEDRALQRAESRPDPFSYLTNAAGQVHIFRERVSIPNVDPSAYQ